MDSVTLGRVSRRGLLVFASLASATAWALDFTGNDTASGTLDSSALEQDINFRDDSSAGSAGISNPSDNFATYFLDDSNAGSATISNSDGGQTIFDGRSSAAKRERTKAPRPRKAL